VSVGDLVVAADGPFIGMMGLITSLPADRWGTRWGTSGHRLATVMWRNGDHQADVSTKYLEIVK